MIESIFCLSLPGAHMTYMGLLVKCILGQARPDDSYLLENGCWHGFNDQLPIEFVDYKKERTRSLDLWKDYHREHCTMFPSVFRDEWRNETVAIMESGINSTDSLVIMNTADSLLERYYRWLNASDRIPHHLYRNMMRSSKYYPRIWKILPKEIKKKELASNAGFSIADTEPNFTVPTLRTSLIDLVDRGYPRVIASFLEANNLDPVIDNDIADMHEKFLNVNMCNVQKAQRLVDRDFWKPRNLLDEILFEGITNNGF